MKNYEKYEEKIREYEGETFCSDFIQPYILKQSGCSGMNCGQCNMISLIWLMKEYEEPREEPRVDWSKVEVDTPILVRNDGGKWYTRHFAKYEDGVVYAWKSGRTSLTEDCMIEWAYAKLIENEEESEIDWDKVKVDTPILVRINEDKEWERRYFAKYENGVVYAWNSGCTSWTTHCMTACMTPWSYAKLAYKEFEVDWSKVEVDTPILVRDFAGDEWVKRHFAKYKNGKVYAWANGVTSRDTEGYAVMWNYAKLAENEETK